MEKNDAPKKHMCTICDYATNRSYDLMRHQNAKHKSNYARDNKNNEDIVSEKNVIRFIKLKNVW